MNERAIVNVQREALFPYITTTGFKYHRIGIRNEEHSPAPARSVVVTLLSVLPEPEWSFNPLPSRIGHKGGYCMSDHCDINPGDEHLFDVARLVIPMAFAPDVNHWAWQTVERHDEPIGLEADTVYQLSFRLTGSNFGPVPFKMQMTLKQDGNLDLVLLG